MRVGLGDRPWPPLRNGPPLKLIGKADLVGEGEEHTEVTGHIELLNCS